MYKALKNFTDGEKGKAWTLAEGGHYYAAGDPYPKSGFNPSKEHIRYLLSNKNAFGRPVIEKVEKDEKIPENISGSKWDKAWESKMED